VWQTCRGSWLKVLNRRGGGALGVFKGYLDRAHYHTEYFDEWRRKGMKLFRRNVGCSLRITARRLQGYDVKVVEKRLFFRQFWIV